MAKFLLLAKENPGNPDAQWEVGQIVGVYPDSHTFGFGEDKREFLARGNDPADWDETFMILEVPGMPYGRAKRRGMRQWKRAAVAGDPEFMAEDAADRFVRLNRRRYRLRMDLLPNPVRRQLQRDGWASIPYSRAVVNAFFKDRDAADEDFDDDS